MRVHLFNNRFWKVKRWEKDQGLICLNLLSFSYILPHFITLFTSFFLKKKKKNQIVYFLYHIIYSLLLFK